MKASTIKRLILWTPTVLTAAWEYARHTFLLPYVSMDTGNVISPILVFLVTVTLLSKLFAMLENVQEQLRREQAVKAAVQERDQMARELHDGISQSLFLLSVKLDRLDRAESPEEVKQASEQIRGTVRHVYEDVREAIASLRSADTAAESGMPWLQPLQDAAAELEESGTSTEIDWQLPDLLLTSREKVELLAIVREALMNVRKHASASLVSVACRQVGADGFRCVVADDGLGASPGAESAKGHYGVRMMRDRAEGAGWSFRFQSPRPDLETGTSVEIMRQPSDAKLKP
ncbi:sensor histidine kinase [Paenibacillus pasadenensis]|uniref:sensor histidine kinase n=1 Tax=Paenibacillus TaxID=44249 RepID=UPI000414C5B4|nr:MULTISPECIES: histidine kinase [Paenibacillus]QGG55478.1 two-component sensor histidine kinase [Paenibacillus sp. B01]